MLDLSGVTLCCIDTANHALALRALRRSAEGRAVPISEPFSGTDQDIALLALGFARGETGSLAVPYAPRGTA